MTPRLSLCMIVRDEAAMAPDFLARVAGLWDELVVVDTGSRDGTPVLFRQAGARVIHRAWDDDFAAARNAGLDQARGEWVLVLDPDERPASDFAAELRATLSDPAIGAARITLCDLFPHGRRRTSRLLRLFRNDPGIRFQHRIHEEVGSAVAAYLARSGLRMAQLRAEVLHLGYVRDHAAARNKKARDRALLESCVARDQADFYSWYKLLELGRFWDDSQLLRDTARRCGPLFERGGPGTMAENPHAGDLVVLLAQGLHAGDSDAALALLDRWEPRLPPSAALWLYRGGLHEAAGRHEAAARDFRACLTLRAATADLQLATVRPLMGLARLAMAAQDHAAARSLAMEALEQAPRDPEALLGAVAVCRRAGGAAGVNELVSTFIRAHGPCSELYEALAEEARLGRRYDEAVEHWKKLAGEPPAGPAGMRLARATLQAGDLEGAARLARALLVSEPAAGLGVLVTDLILGRDSALELDLAQEVADAELRAWVDVVGGPDRARLAANAGEVAGVFPWLPAYLATGA